MKIAVAADHGGFEMKRMLVARLRSMGHEVTDFGATVPDPNDDYPDYIIPLARAVSAGEVNRGIVICGSGVGASVAAIPSTTEKARTRSALWKVPRAISGRSRSSWVGRNRPGSPR